MISFGQTNRCTHHKRIHFQLLQLLWHGRTHVSVIPAKEIVELMNQILILIDYFRTLRKEANTGSDSKTNTPRASIKGLQILQ